MLDPLLTFSDALVSRVAGSGAGLVCIHPGVGAQRTATLWRPGVLMTSEQGLSSDAAIPPVLPGGILLAVNGVAVPPTRGAMAKALESRAAGTRTTLRLSRGGTPTEPPIVVAARPAA